MMQTYSAICCIIFDFYNTAPDLQTALALVREKIFHGDPLPPLIEVIEDVDVSTLDEDHVRSSMAPPYNYGI